MPTAIRPLFAALLALALAACSTLGAVTALLGDEVAFTRPQLQSALDRNFPRDYDQLGGLVSITLLNPRLSIPPGSDRVRVDFDLGFAALGGDSRTPRGRFAVVSGLRYDPQTRGLHLQDPSLESVEVPELGGALDATARGVLNGWLADYARSEPVYRFDNSLLDRIGARRIDRTEVVNGQVVVHLDD